MRKILMPPAGKSPGSLTVRKWLKAKGQTLRPGEMLMTLESPEGLVELELATGGTLSAILLPEGKSANPGTEIAEIEDAATSTPKVETESMSSKPTTGHAIPVVMPQAGNSMEEGTIIKWLVKEGDRVEKGQALFEIETDKANMEVEAPEAGRIAKIVAGEGATVPVKQPVAFMGEEGVEIGDAPQAEEKKITTETQRHGCAPVAPVAAANVGAGIENRTGPVIASPAARRIAREQGLDLASVGTGSGPNGRILSTDLSRASAGKSAAVAATAPALRAAPPVVAGAGAVRKKMSKMRKAIAANLSLSKQTIPHFYLRCTINADPLMSYYRGEKAKYPCSVNDVVTLAVARCIMEFPAFRSKIDGDEIVEFPAANVGVAVGVEDGLTVPVLLGANAMSLQQVAANTKRIVENARSGKLEGWGEGNFTITNLGMFGVEEFAAIVNPSEPGILAVGAVRESVVVKDGAMKPGRVMTMTLSCDHRVIDGLLAAKFMARLKEVLENPTLLG